MQIEVNTRAKIDLKDIISTLQELTPKQKAQIAVQLSKWCGSIDMTYVEQALKALAKIEYKRTKNRELYNRNRPYFKSIKNISKLKFAE